ncbi:hypothetical protein [Vineibacter terrae]|uniref:hypothetical protein n=1 Tax=Vineibacter terrae TaxID=2586908 RepID=UPI002E349BBA|nr:hypothetical protein [Vineibacter terrae]HEX2888464.1 hypothetical protein [Vineibacter terrae]
MIGRFGRAVLGTVVAATMLMAGAAMAMAAELVMFHSRSCPWCAAWDRDIGPVYGKTPEGRLLALRRVDADRSTDGGVRLARPVDVTPTFVIVACGREVGRITGYPGEDHFWGLLGIEIERLRTTLAAKC